MRFLICISLLFFASFLFGQEETKMHLKQIQRSGGAVGDVIRMQSDSSFASEKLNYFEQILTPASAREGDVWKINNGSGETFIFADSSWQLIRKPENLEISENAIDDRPVFVYTQSTNFIESAIANNFFQKGDRRTICTQNAHLILIAPLGTSHTIGGQSKDTIDAGECKIFLFDGVDNWIIISEKGQSDTNEAQNLSLNNDTLKISDGNEVDLGYFSTDQDLEIATEKIPKSNDPVLQSIDDLDLFYVFDTSETAKKVISFDSLLFLIADSLGCQLSSSVDTNFKEFVGDIQFNGGSDPLPQIHNFIFSGISPTYKNIASATDMGNGDLRFNSNPPTKSGAQTIQVSEGNGTYIEHTYLGNDNNGYMGLSVNGTNQGHLFGEMDYGIRWCVPSNGGNPNELFTHENGTGGFIGVTIAANDIIRVEIQNGVVVAKKNGVIIHTYTALPFSTITASEASFDCTGGQALFKSPFRDNDEEITNSVDVDIKRNGKIGLGIGIDTSRALLHLRQDPSALTILPTTLANNGTMLLIENNLQTGGGFNGIGLVSYNNSCSHIHWGDNDDAAMGEIAWNNPTDELSICLGNTPLGTGPGAAWGRKPFRWNMNVDGQIYHGQKGGDAVLADYAAHLTVDMTDTFEADTTQSGIRLVNEYSNEKMDISFGVKGDFKINSGAIFLQYNGDWSSNMSLLVRDDTIGEDLDSNFQNLWEAVLIEGKDKNVVINGTCKIIDLLQLEPVSATSVENTTPDDGAVIMTNDVGTIPPFTGGAGIYYRLLGVWRKLNDL